MVHFLKILELTIFKVNFWIQPNYQSSTRSHCNFEYLKSYFLTTHRGRNTSQEASGECMPQDKGVGQRERMALEIGNLGNRESFREGTEVLS